jgi:hypothetical protein
MPYLTTGSTELKAVNQILASVGQAPVTTLTTEETLVINEVSRFTGSISGTTLTTETANIPVGTYIGGTGVTTGTSIAVAGVEATPATDPVTYEYTLNISQTVSERTLTRNEVTSRVETQANPDVAIALNTLREVSREVQSEGWTFNREFDYTLTPDSNDEILIPDDMLQVDLNISSKRSGNRQFDSVNRGGKLYDRIKHTYKWTDASVQADILWYFEWEYIPDPIQGFIVARAAAIFASRTMNDSNLYQILQQKEAFARAMAMEYECTQGDYSFFGEPQGENYYNSFKPFHTLQR